MNTFLATREGICGDFSEDHETQFGSIPRTMISLWLDPICVIAKPLDILAAQPIHCGDILLTWPVI